MPLGPLIFHIATRSDWEEARESGTYTTSTAGRTLTEEGFIHASRREQVRGVFDRYYRSLGVPLVLLTIDPTKLTDAEVRIESVGNDTYPHIYGPLNPAAVVQAVPLDRNGRIETVGSLFVKEMGLRMGAAVVVMALSAIGLVVGGSLGAQTSGGQFAGFLVGAVLGALLVWWLARRRAG